MSECVVRMDMPQDGVCDGCGARIFEFLAGPICTIKKKILGSSRPSWCPIICSLPEGHGDLVDWKDVEKELDKSFCSVVDDGPCMGPYMLKRKEYPQALIERPIRVNIIVPAERSET